MRYKKTKGIVLAGGAGTRLYPLSQVYSKQLVAVFDKPMIYYPISTLIYAGINEILIISDSDTLPIYEKIFSDGVKLGLKISYAVQDKPNGIAEAFIIGKEFIGNDNVALILGDNIFYGGNDIFYDAVAKANAGQTDKISTIFSLYVNEPERYGVVKFSEDNKPIEVIEKPNNHISNFAVPGFYIYDSRVVQVAENLKPSERGELEITHVNNYYLQNDNLNVIKLHTGITWFDCGTSISLLNASNFIASIEERHGIKLGCYEEAAFNMNFIDESQITDYIKHIPNCNYKNYLTKTIAEHTR